MFHSRMVKYVYLRDIKKHGNYNICEEVNINKTKFLTILYKK